MSPIASPDGHQHRHHVDQHLTEVMSRDETSTGECVRHLPVSSTRSASSRTAADPANAPPDPSSVADNPCAHPIRFTWKVLIDQGPTCLSKDMFPLARGVFAIPTHR